MIIATSITPDYLERSMPFFESVSEHFTGKKVCFCIGFYAVIKGWHTIPVMSKDIDWQPTNRRGYYSLQHGEFTKFFKFDKGEMILFMDSDIIMQRPFDLNLHTDKVYVTNNSYPRLTIKQAVKNIDGNKLALERLGTKKEFCAGWVCMSLEKWKKVHEFVWVNQYYLSYFKHHAAMQVLINLAVHEYYKPIYLPAHVCNAIWYHGTAAKKEGDELIVGGEVVYFNHTKFNKEWE